VAVGRPAASRVGFESSRPSRGTASSGLSCFAAVAMGSELADEDFYRSRQLFGGLACPDDDLRRIFCWPKEVEVRRMPAYPANAGVFDEPFL